MKSPRSKWHSVLKSNQANHGHKAKPTNKTLSVPTRLTYSENPKKLTSTTQEPQYQKQQIYEQPNSETIIVNLKNCSQEIIPITIDTQQNSKILLITTNTVDKVKEPIVASQQQIIRIPFLPRPEQITLLMKKSLPIKKNLNLKKKSQKQTHLNVQNSQVLQTQTINSTTDTVCQCICNCKSLNSSKETIATKESTPPMTLASMAGIQLTDIMEESHQDMSGAMPTATVEEINVPVFIDEYLQEIESSTSTNTTTATINNNCNGYGNEYCLENETFEPFDFDIDMITERIQEESSNSNNNFNSIDYVNDNMNSIMNVKEQKDSIENMDISDLFDDKLNQSNAYDLNVATDDAVNFYTKKDEWSFSQVLSRSQDPYLGEAISISNNNSQTLIANAEPVVPAFDQDTQFEICNGFNDSQNIIKYINNVDLDVTEIIRSDSNALKRPADSTDFTTMAKKRSKLCLDTSLFSQHVDSSEVMKTPEFIERVLDMEKDAKLHRHIGIDIINELFNYSNSSYQSNTTEYYDNYGEDQPNTPQSCTSVHTNQTSNTDFTSSPTSPAFSVSSTSQNVSNNGKKKRGRPSKEHSDSLNPQQLKQLPEEQRKVAIARYNNNEASRKSRLKNKEREALEISEENKLIERNIQLKLLLKIEQRIEQKLKAELYLSIQR